MMKPAFLFSPIACLIMLTCVPGAPFCQAEPPVSKLSAIAEGMQWVGKAVDEPDYYVWCTSPIQGPDNKTHLFCSRWPKKYKMGGWVTNCEIAHYVGDTPEGPFKFVDIALESHPDALWNNSMHNPAIARAGDKYVLLYISFDKRTDRPYLVDKRHCMFTGMAVSDSLNGPWKKLGDGGMVFTPSPDPEHWTYHTWAMDNPTFLAHGGKFYIYFKAAQQQMKSRYGYAVADCLEGPYRLSDAPCTDNINYIEDATAFVWNNKICLLTNDNMGTHTGVGGQGILWMSDVPTDFKLTNAEVGFLSTSDYCNADRSKARALYGGAFKFERPGILMLNGKPAYFYGPSGVNLDGDDHTCSYVMKIDLEHNHRPHIPENYVVAASSTFGSQYGPEKAFDGSFLTRWAASEPQQPAWVTVDLGAARTVKRVVLDEGGFSRAQSFELQTKNSAGEWETFYHGTTIGSKKEVLLEKPVTSQFFKIQMHSPGAMNLSEFQLLEK